MLHQVKIYDKIRITDYYTNVADIHNK